MTPTLNPLKDTCKAGEVTLKAGQTIDYKSATERKISMGKIVSFMYPGNRQENTGSVWMRVVDVENVQMSEWLSVGVWYDQHKRGMFTKLQTSKQAAKNDSPEPEDDIDLPF